MKLSLKHLGDSLGSRLRHFLLTILCCPAAVATSPGGPDLPNGVND